MCSKKIVYPYIPNSVPEVKKKMLNELGIDNSEDLFFEIP